ncbi:MAG: hypothetical protein FJY85_10160 [Deltaproteobacteria bacterium]|nr:hypothetical protein [Deltaproteobacteria bacterium]
MPFGPNYQETNALVRGLENVEEWLRDLRTSSPKLSTLVPNFELELRRATPHFKQLIRCLLELLDTKLPAARGDEDRWYDPSLLFEEVSEESGMCLFGPDVRAAPPPDLMTNCCYEEPKSDYPTEDLLCKVTALGDLKRFNLNLTDLYDRLSDEDLMRSLQAIPRVGELRGRRPFNWVAKRDELENEVTRAKEAKVAGGPGEWTEQDRATRIRDILGLDNYADQDYLVLITFPENTKLEKQVRSSVWEGACARFDHGPRRCPAPPRGRT